MCLFLIFWNCASCKSNLKDEKLPGCFANPRWMFESCKFVIWISIDNENNGEEMRRTDQLSLGVCDSAITGSNLHRFLMNGDAEKEKMATKNKKIYFWMVLCLSTDVFLSSMPNFSSFFFIPTRRWKEYLPLAAAQHWQLNGHRRGQWVKPRGERQFFFRKTFSVFVGGGRRERNRQQWDARLHSYVPIQSLITHFHSKFQCTVVIYRQNGLVR